MKYIIYPVFEDKSLKKGITFFANPDKILEK